VGRQRHHRAELTSVREIEIEMWWQIVNVALGVWLMAAPGVLGYGRPASTSDQIAGPLVATFACIAIWESTRAVRWLSLPVAIWVMASPWILSYPFSGQISNLLSGMTIATLSSLGGAIRQQFGGGWSALWREA
jgi:hypothetical protein